MMTYTLSMFNTGQVTLPKSYRDQFKTNIFVARTKGKKLIIEPIEETPEQLKDENIEIYDEGNGIFFKKGLSGEGLDYFIKHLENNV
jgi:bifunctional DNA-binding transcriptional regulator/antitoxin component of YhaV-PrlF toxin-antitoxin module